jgi:dihydroorotase-like cyclic amidohydrolase
MGSPGSLLERLQFVKGIDPIADMNNGTVASDVIDMSAFSRIVFVVYKGVATGGTAAGTYTVLACDNTTPSNTTAVPFQYRKALGALANATTTGFQSTAGSSSIDVIEVREDAVASTGYRYIELSIAETVNDPIVACVLVLGELKDAAATYATVTD